MKKLMMLMLAVGLMSSPCLFAANGNQQAGARLANKYNQTLDGNGVGQVDGCKIDPCKEYASGPCKCYCPMTKYVPQYYKTCRCEWEPYCVQKKCYRTVPEYYTKTYCKPRKECYYVSETKYRPKYCYDQHCKYVPCTYVKCCSVDNPCGSNGGGSTSHGAGGQGAGGSGS